MELPTAFEVDGVFPKPGVPLKGLYRVYIERKRYRYMYIYTYIGFRVSRNSGYLHGGSP